MSSIKAVSFILAITLIPSSSFATSDANSGLLNKAKYLAGAAAGVALVLAATVSAVGKEAIVPDKETGEVSKYHKLSNSTLAQSYIQSVMYWQSINEPNPNNGKALLVLPGNGWGFEAAVKYSAEDLPEHDDLSKTIRDYNVNIFTMAYLGQGSTMIDSNMLRPQSAQITAVKEMIRHIIGMGYKASDITIFAHSIGGMLSGCALAGEEDFKDIKLLAVASPNSIGKILSDSLEKPFNYLTGWTSRPSAAFTSNNRIAVNSKEFDEVVPYTASIASAVELNSCKGHIIADLTQGHANFSSLDTEVSVKQYPNHLFLSEVLISLLTKNSNKILNNRIDLSKFKTYEDYVITVGLDEERAFNNLRRELSPREIKKLNLNVYKSNGSKPTSSRILLISARAEAYFNYLKTDSM